MTAEDFDPARLKPAWVTAGGDLKPSATTDQYNGGTPGPGDLKPSLVDAAGNLKPSVRNAGPG